MFNQDELKNITLTKENDIPNVAEFSRKNPNVTLGSFPEYDELYKKEMPKIDITQLSNYENNLMRENKSDEPETLFKTQKDKSIELKRTRAKIYITMFLSVTFILTAFVIYNLIATIMLNNKISNNSSKIKNINKLIDKITEDNNDQPSLANVELPKDLNL